jgi:hypothetical protein
MPMAERKVIVHLFALVYGELLRRIEEINASFEAQRVETPQLSRYPNRKLNVQLGNSCRRMRVRPTPFLCACSLTATTST